MKIQKLILRNFSAVYHAMNTTEIEIDFSTSLNKICLLIGPNGSGKTTILGQLQPFADVGNLDVRNGNQLIRKDKEGYKEIHIKTDESTYIIKHIYSPHKDKSHSVKSYIEKDGCELNINGNVSSFKEYIKEELHIEPDYLKLIRLGSNVMSLIGMTSTDRKNFMSKIMDDIGIYLEYYKSVNTKLRQLSDMISHTVDKLNRLGIIDKSERKDEIKKLELEIEDLNKLYINENNEIAISKNILEKIEDLDMLAENKKFYTKKYKKMSVVFEKKDSFESYDVSFYDKKIRNLEKEINKIENTISSNEIILDNSLSYLNTLNEQLHAFDIQLSKELNSDKEIERIEDEIKKLRLQMRECEDILGEFKPEFTKQELDSFVVFLKNTQNILGRTYEFGKIPVSKVIELMRNKKNVNHYINSHLMDIDEKNNDQDSLLLLRFASKFNIVDGEVIENQVVSECKEECPAKFIYNQLRNLIIDNEVKDKNEDTSFYHDMEFVHQNIIAALNKFSDYKDIIDRLPSKIKKSFQIENMYKAIEKLGMIYNEKDMNELMTLSSEYELYKKIEEKYEFNINMSKRLSSVSNTEYINTQLKNTKETIENEEDKIYDIKEKNILLREELKEDMHSLEVYQEIKETLEKYDEVKSLYERYEKEYEIFNKTTEDITNHSLKANKIKIEIEYKTKDLQEKISSLDQYKILNKDLENMNTIYDDMTFVKTALSSKSGIPLHIIQGYLDNVEDITNSLLDIAYDGNIYIDNFDITPTEFSIPFINKGLRLSDVKYASQGELSFLSIALSFALASKKLSKYNIMLLDEIDAPLDMKNREKFIKILENQIDRIDSEQNFAITHNSMFSSYPVDILDLSFNEKNEDYKLANYITINRK